MSIVSLCLLSQRVSLSCLHHPFVVGSFFTVGGFLLVFRGDQTAKTNQVAPEDEQDESSRLEEAVSQLMHTARSQALEMGSVDGRGFGRAARQGTFQGDGLRCGSRHCRLHWCHARTRT